MHGGDGLSFVADLGDRLAGRAACRAAACPCPGPLRSGGEGDPPGQDQDFPVLLQGQALALERSSRASIDRAFAAARKCPESAPAAP